MLTHNPDNNLVGGCNKHPGQSFLNCYYCMLDNNLVGQEIVDEGVKNTLLNLAKSFPNQNPNTKKGINKQPVNCWIPIENYLPSVQHKFLLVDIGVDYILGTIGFLMKKKTIMTCDSYGNPAYSIENIKRVMILSRK